MNKYLTLLWVTLSLLWGVVATSCQERIDPTEEWRRSNELAFASFEKNQAYQKQTIDGLTPYVYMRWIERGKGTQHPIETSRVVVHYALELLVSRNGAQETIENTFTQEEGTLIALNRGLKNRTIVGFQIALQKMVEGDRAEIIIPWYLGYGVKAQNNIPAYSALRYIVRLDSIVPETTP